MTRFLITYTTIFSVLMLTVVTAWTQDMEKPTEAAISAVAAAATTTPAVEAPAASSRQVAYGPGMVPLKPGVYLIITIPDDPKLPVVAQTFTVGKTDVDPPDPDDPVNIQIRNMLTPIVDPDKARTANDLVMGLSVGPLALIEDGKITTLAGAQEATNATVKFMLGARGKTEAWRPFSEGMQELVSGCNDLVSCTALLKVAIKELEAIQ